jgi:hypothetical protein
MTQIPLPPVINFWIDSQPGFILSAYQPLIFKVKSNVTRPELQVRGSVYARNVLTDAFTLLAQKYQKRYLDNDYFIFDVSDLIRKQLTFDRQTYRSSAKMVTENTQSICEYKVVFSLIFYDAYGFPTVSGSLTSDALFATNSVLQHEDTQSLSAYILPDSVTGGSFGYEFSNDFDVE